MKTYTNPEVKVTEIDSECLLNDVSGSGVTQPETPKEEDAGGAASKAYSATDDWDI